MPQDFIILFMNDHISKLLNFFNQYLNDLSTHKIISEVNKKNINIDYNSKSKQGDVSSNFYLIIQKKILDKNFDLKSDLKNKLIKFEFIEKTEISNSGFINIFFVGMFDILRGFNFERVDRVLPIAFVLLFTMYISLLKNQSLKKIFYTLSFSSISSGNGSYNLKIAEYGISVNVSISDFIFVTKCLWSSPKCK